MGHKVKEFKNMNPSSQRKDLAMIGARLGFILLFFLASTLVHAGEFTLSSPTIKPGAALSEEQVFNGFGCAGKNLSPALEWTKGPKGTKSYAITVYDPDAPTGSGWWHWIVYNIPANVTTIALGAGDATGKKLPLGALQGRTDFGTHAFGGACPPQGDTPHRYIFTVHALKIEKIEVAPDASAAMIGFMINANSLGKASFTATYGR
jgi:Raf kinase inhibitor-like YbhB/YbcL family protein